MALERRHSITRDIGSGADDGSQRRQFRSGLYELCVTATSSLQIDLFDRAALFIFSVAPAFAVQPLPLRHPVNCRSGWFIFLRRSRWLGVAARQSHGQS